MKKKYIPLMTLAVVNALLLLALALFLWVPGIRQAIAAPSSKVRAEQSRLDPATNKALLAKGEEEFKAKKEVTALQARPEKTAEEKQAVMDADAATMSSLGLYYDYANLTLPEVVQAFMAEKGISGNQIAFSYKDISSGTTYHMNESQPMVAGSTYKLPLNMLVVDEVRKGNLSMDQSFDITGLNAENPNELQTYINAFGGQMTITDMQRFSLVYSENTPAYALASLLGGFTEFHNLLTRYGQSTNPDLPTISSAGNLTTTSYYIQVLEYLYNHQETYKDIIQFIGSSFQGEYYKTYLPGIEIDQKPGFVSNALNVDAIVYEERPYLIAIYTAGLGGAPESATEINGVGYNQLTQLCYVVNEWHRVNMN